MSGGLRLQLTSSRPGPPRRRLLARDLHGPTRVEQVSFHCGRRCGHAAPDPSSLFSQGWPPDKLPLGGIENCRSIPSALLPFCWSLLLVWKDFFARCAPSLSAAAPIDGDTSKQCPGGTAESPDRMPPNLSEPRLNLLIFEPASTEPAMCLPPNSILHPSTRLNIYAHLLSLQRTQNPIVSEKPGVR